MLNLKVREERVYPTDRPPLEEKEPETLLVKDVFFEALLWKSCLRPAVGWKPRSWLEAGSWLEAEEVAEKTRSQEGGGRQCGDID